MQVSRKRALQEEPGHVPETAGRPEWLPQSQQGRTEYNMKSK